MKLNIFAKDHLRKGLEDNLHHARLALEKHRSNLEQEQAFVTLYEGRTKRLEAQLAAMPDPKAEKAQQKAQDRQPRREDFALTRHAELAAA
jgi:hypothetical protein